MSGPALRNVDSHASIHEAALEEARELTAMLAQCLNAGDADRALEVAFVAIEHWETRTLQHAASEEEGLYREMALARPELRDTIISLTRDHQLMRELAQDIRELLASEGASIGVLDRFRAMIRIDEIHNRDEERMIGHTEVMGHADGEAV
ncbi:hemerythrin domain-containing protein [Paenibacillus sp. SAF-054]|uniref:hemerythrin domain-containing protein n=1 Tax=unclassified Paenibacillus TaxID=185978 RepID=UPI003F821324